MIIKSILSLLLFAGMSSAMSQSNEHFMCGNNHEQKIYFKNHPEAEAAFKKDQVEFEEFYQDFVTNEYSPMSRAATYVIPVVVHVVHLDGPENISDEQIYNAIDWINKDFSESNSDLGNTVSAFRSVTGDASVEFRLARKDPKGNCHTGITRTYSVNTDHNSSDPGMLNDVIREHGVWPQNSYMNIIVCKSINGSAAGYTTTPGNWYTPTSMGGSIYLEHTYTGSIGTASTGTRHTLSHEVGHWLNLSHPWGSSNNPELSGNCNMDDGVGDTPNTIGWRTCVLDGESCGSLDNVQNIMEYSYCSTMFTDGQAARMQAALNHTTAQRNNLWTQENLEKTGVLDGGELCRADFTANRLTVCAGSSINFEDLSFHNVSSRNWNFEGGTPSSSSEESPVITYNEPGTYEVDLTVSDGFNSDSAVKPGYVVVLNSPGITLPFREGFESLDKLPNIETVFVENSDDGEAFEIFDGGGSSGTASAVLSNFGVTNGTKDALVSVPIDLTSVNDGDPPILSFKYAYKKKSSNNVEKLSVFISANCGESWVLRKQLRGDDLSDLSQGASYVPSGNSEWREVRVETITPSYYVDNFRFKIEFENDNGNNIYIDDINLETQESLSIDEDNNIENQSKIYPNPASDIVVVTFDKATTDEISIVMTDITGKLVKDFGSFLSEDLVALPVSDMPAGIYMVSVTHGVEKKTHKLLID